MQTIDRVPLVSQAGWGSPTAPSAVLSRPDRRSKIQPKSSPITTGDSSFGRNTVARNTPRKRIRWFSSSRDADRQRDRQDDEADDEDDGVPGRGPEVVVVEQPLVVAPPTGVNVRPLRLSYRLMLKALIAG